jgi:predicted dehydrogenase
MTQFRVTYNFEYERKLRVCFIGAGLHSFRNVYPVFQYAPVDLLAICDINEQRASDFARQFGAERHYTDHLEMFDQEKPDAVFIVTSYHPDGRVQATDLALDALKRGIHVWMEKPTAASVEEIHQLMDASQASGAYVLTGLKKVFFPAVEKTKQIIHSEEFGQPTSIYIRYPEFLPSQDKRKDLTEMTTFLDHIYHPGSIIHYLMGKIEKIHFERSFNGGSVTNIKFLSGAVGTMHLVHGLSGSSPLERLEVIGTNKSNVIVDNGVKVTYYRNANRPAYGRSASYMVPDENAPLHWEPEFSLGQLYNKNIFMMGYVPEVLHFCESILEGKPPVKGTLEASLEIAKLFEAYRYGADGESIILNKPE